MQSNLKTKIWARIEHFLNHPNDTHAISEMAACESSCRITDTRASFDPSPVIAFTMLDVDHKPHRILCDPSIFALLLLVVEQGQSIFLDRADGRPYLKMFGKLPKSAGYCVARIAAGVEDGESVRFKDGNSLNLTFTNLTMQGNKRAKRGTLYWYAELLSADVAYFDEAKKLLHEIMDRIDAERGFCG